MKNLMLALIILIFFANCKKEETGNFTEKDKYDSIINVIKNDMRLAHEAIPHGIPDAYNWKYFPRIGAGNNCPTDWNAFVSWGQLFVDESQNNSENPAPNTRVAIKNIKAYLLKGSGQWTVLQIDNHVTGALFAEDFQNNTNIVANIRTETEGGISVTAGQGYNFHFYANNRVNINPTDIKGILVAIEARLILDNPSGIDDREYSKYILSAGADYWKNLSAFWSPDLSNNGDVGIGRFKKVTKYWRTFYVHSIKSEDFEKFPIPKEYL